MKKVIWSAVASAALAMGYTPAVSAKGLMVEANGARAQGEWGGEFGVGYAFGAGGFRLRPIVGVFVFAGDNDRYYTDELSNGQERCRDSNNGQFAKDSKCDNTKVKPYGKVEATYSIPLFGEVGVGARFSSSKVRAYGTAAVPLAPKIALKANVGDRYYAVGLRAGF